MHAGVNNPGKRYFPSFGKSDDLSWIPMTIAYFLRQCEYGNSFYPTSMPILRCIVQADMEQRRSDTSSMGIRND